MKKLNSLLLCLALCASLFAAEKTNISAEELLTYPQIVSGLELFDAWLDNQYNQQQIPGVIVGIVYKDKLLWSKAIGTASIKEQRKITLDAVCPIGSLTQCFVSCAILRLWQEGKLDLDASINRYLPVFSIKGYRPSDQAITVRQLLNHTSGLPQDPDFPYYNDLKFPDFESIWKSLPRLEMIYAPHLRWKYSNLGYVLLGKIIESVSGKSYEDYIYEKILFALEMNHAAFVLSPKQKQNCPVGHTLTINGGQQSLAVYDTNGMSAALGLYASLQDLQRFSSYFLTKTTDTMVLNPAARRHLFAPTVDVRPFVSFSLGFSVRKLAHQLLFEHSGTMPGYSSILSLNLPDHCGLIVLSNSQEWLTPFADAASRWVYTAIHDVHTGHTVKKVSSRFTEYCGKYANQQGAIYFVEYNGALVIYQPQYSNMLDVLVQEGEDRFRILNGYAFGCTNGDPVHFERNDDKTIKRVKIASMYLSKN